MQPRHESRVAYELRERSIENFVPTFRRRRGKRTVELPLFPGYVFCKLAVRDRSVAAFISSVIFVGNARHGDVSQDVEDLRRVISSGLMYAPWPYTRTGRRAIIEEGPLDGLNGFVIDPTHLVLSLRSLSRSLLVETDLTCRLVSDVEGTHPQWGASLPGESE